MNPDALSLEQKAQESLAVARELAGGGHHDFAASRAYYAMFYIAEAVLLERGIASSSHRAIHSGFFHELVETGIVDRRLHQSFVRGFELRQAGDDGVFDSVSKEQCSDLMHRAAEFVNALKRILHTTK